MYAENISQRIEKYKFIFKKYLATYLKVKCNTHLLIEHQTTKGDFKMKKITMALLTALMLMQGFTAYAKTTFTLPAFTAQNLKTQKDADTYGKANGITITKNADGTYSCVCNDEAKTKATIAATLAKLKIKGVKAIEPNANYTEFTVKIDSEKMTMVQKAANFACGNIGFLYNSVNGTPADAITVKYVTPSGKVASTETIK